MLLSDFDGWWLDTRCGCGRSTQIPIRMLLREWRRETDIGQIARRLRCRGCGARPASTELVDDIQAGAKGYAGGGPVQRIKV